MDYQELINKINAYTQYAQQKDAYDIALMKIWIQFEKFLKEYFDRYLISQPSEINYAPALKLNFDDANHFYNLVRPVGAKYIDYYDSIMRLAKYVFVNDPFNAVMLNPDINESFGRIVALRNYIAHESPESKEKLVKKCFSSHAERFIEPNMYLKLPYSKKIHKTTYSVYIENIVLAADIIIGKYQGIIV